MEVAILHEDFEYLTGFAFEEAVIWQDQGGAAAG